MFFKLQKTVQACLTENIQFSANDCKLTQSHMMQRQEKSYNTHLWIQCTVYHTELQIIISVKKFHQFLRSI